jgi:hypothetical protein
MYNPSLSALFQPCQHTTQMVCRSIESSYSTITPKQQMMECAAQYDNNSILHAVPKCGQSAVKPYAANTLL